MQTKLDINLSDLDLPFSSSCIMDYNDAAIVQDGDFIAVGYLADDTDCENPLTSCDGNGHIYNAHRFSDTHGEMQEALALDSYWSPDYELLDDHKPTVRTAWVNAAMNSSEFLVWADDTAGPRARKDDAYYRRRALKLWREVEDESVENMEIFQFSFTDDVCTQVWRELRNAGLIGDPDAVVLDVYEHGGQVWSLSGGGMQCRFDTANGAGVWVPDSCAREEVERRAKVYAFGLVSSNGAWTRGSGKRRYFAQIDEDFGSERSPDFMEWHDAFSWLEAKAETLKLARGKVKRAAQERLGRERAAREIASSALEEYNEWLSGACYGVVVASFCNVGSAEEPEWEFIESDECWGYIGDEYAMEEASSQAKAIVESRQAKSA